MGKTFCFLCTIIIVTYSCTSKNDSSIEYAGDNNVELQRVLDYFEDGSNPLKYEAAKFLIENMPYHYTFNGDAVEWFN